MQLLDLTAIDISIQYILFDQAVNYHLQSPFHGYLHTFLFNKKQAAKQSYCLANLRFEIQTGDHVNHPIQAGDTLQWTNEAQEATGLALFISRETINSLLSSISDQAHLFDKHAVYHIDNLADHILHQITELHKEERPINKLRIPSLITEMLIYQFESILLKQRKKEIPISRTNFEKIRQAQQVIESDLSKNYSIAELSKLVGTNEQYLKKHFKQCLGKTIMTYSTELKLQHAKTLLINSEYRISDIARMLGYKHPTHFSTAFKKHFGYVPNTLRTP